MGRVILKNFFEAEVKSDLPAFSAEIELPRALFKHIYEKFPTDETNKFKDLNNKAHTLGVLEYNLDNAKNAEIGNRAVACIITANSVGCVAIVLLGLIVGQPVLSAIYIGIVLAQGVGLGKELDGSFTFTNTFTGTFRYVYERLNRRSFHQSAVDEEFNSVKEGLIAAGNFFDDHTDEEIRERLGTWGTEVPAELSPEFRDALYYWNERHPDVANPSFEHYDNLHELQTRVLIIELEKTMRELMAIMVSEGVILNGKNYVIK